MKKIVAIGGGSGLATLLRSIRDYPIEITAIVTMTDDGASTGRLRKEFDTLPPGDMRKCIAALSDKEDLLLDLFQYRFKKGVGLKGHSLGNLLISAAGEVYGNFESAIGGICEIFSIKGRILPSTLSNIGLVAGFTNGKKIKGESKITKYGYTHKIATIFLNKKAKANQKAIKAITEADYILVGPGSLYTSIIPNFLLSGILNSYQRSKAVKIYVCNISTERGETDGFSVPDHLQVLNNFGICFDQTLVNNRLFEKGLGDGFIVPVKLDLEQETKNFFVEKDLVNDKNPLYHDIDKLGREVWQIILKKRRKLSNPFFD